MKNGHFCFPTKFDHFQIFFMNRRINRPSHQSLESKLVSILAEAPWKLWENGTILDKISLHWKRYKLDSMFHIQMSAFSPYLIELCQQKILHHESFSKKFSGVGSWLFAFFVIFGPHISHRGVHCCILLKIDSKVQNINPKWASKNCFEVSRLENKHIIQTYFQTFAIWKICIKFFLYCMTVWR